MKQRRFFLRATLAVVAIGAAVTLVHGGDPHSGYLPFYHERPTHNETCDPRPNILRDELYNHHVPYRRTYNRPRNSVGYLVHIIEPTSQEAMVWWENMCAGNYKTKNAPPMCKRYWYPKPWEAMDTGPRLDFAKPASVNTNYSLRPNGQANTFVDQSATVEAPVPPTIN